MGSWQRLSSIKALLVIFMMTVILLPSISSASHQCSSHQNQQTASASLDSHNETAPHHESHDCTCPTHRVDSCHYQATPRLPKWTLASIYAEIEYSQDLFTIPGAPILEGPFQPPRA